MPTSTCNPWLPGQGSFPEQSMGEEKGEKYSTQPCPCTTAWGVSKAGKRDSQIFSSLLKKQQALLSILSWVLKMFVWQKKKKKGEMTVVPMVCSSVKMYFSFQAEWILSWIGVEQTRWFYFFILPKLFLNHSTQILILIFFYPSLATIANNSIICMALIAVIKQTQQTLTLCRASSQPHSQLGLYFVSREGDVALCRLKINYGLSGIFFPPPNWYTISLENE